MPIARKCPFCGLNVNSPCYSREDADRCRTKVLPQIDINLDEEVATE
jgi:hypothetical protein